MPYKIVLNCFHRETEIVGNSPLVSNDAKVLEFLTVLENLHQALPLKSFDLKQKGDPADNKYSYEFKTVDGRAWKQTLVVPPLPAVPSMSFDINNLFTQTEFGPHRSVRDVVIVLITAFAVAKIHVEWPLAP